MSKEDNNSVVFDVDRFLLFHPQDNLTYIRKLSMSYGYYTALAVVDKNNRVTHVGVDNDFHIVAYANLKDDDLLSVYRINEVLKLKEPFKLWKPCRSMRYTTLDETYHLKKSMLATLNHKIEPVHVNKFDYYSTMYGENVSLDLDNLDFNLDKELREIELQRFNDLKATGQTRLI